MSVCPLPRKSKAIDKREGAGRETERLRIQQQQQHPSSSSSINRHHQMDLITSTMPSRPTPPERRLTIRMSKTTKAELFLVAGCTCVKLQNIALGRPAYLSSLEVGYLTPDKAVDGNLDHEYRNCAGSKYEENPWWAVDLGKKLGKKRALDFVRITNRDGYGGRLHDFTVGVRDSAPSSPMNTSDYEVCAHYPHRAMNSETVEVQLFCAPGRFLVIQIIGTREMVTLCEVQVFAQPSSRFYSCESGQALVGEVLTTITVPLSMLKCGIKCQGNWQCKSFNYKAGVCTLFGAAAAVENNVQGDAASTYCN